MSSGYISGRTFEDAFMLANPEIFDIHGATENDKATNAWIEVGKLKKSEFALKHAISETDWKAPSYILDGLKWLATADVPIVADATAPVVEDGGGTND